VNCEQELAHALQHPGKITAQTPIERAINLILCSADDVWLRHGAEQPEHTTYDTRQPWPELRTRISVGAAMQDPRTGWFAVDLDRYPFRGFAEHPVETVSGYPWSYIVGLLPVRRFRNRGGSLWQPSDRDHYYARGTVTAGEWLFLWREFDEHTQDLHTQEHARARLWDSGAAQISWEELQQFTHAWHHLQNLAAVQNLIEPDKREASAPPKSRSR
jgi:hypothetical protein